jgi:hypothetical protein
LLAEVSALLRDAGTHRAVVESIPMESPDVRKSMLSDYERLQDRQTVIRKQLVAMAIGDPSPKVRRLIGELGEALDSSLFLTWYRTVNREGGAMDTPVFAEFTKDGERDHRNALALLDELIEAL